MTDRQQPKHHPYIQIKQTDNGPFLMIVMHGNFGMQLTPAEAIKMGLALMEHGLELRARLKESK